MPVPATMISGRDGDMRENSAGGKISVRFGRRVYYLSTRWRHPAGGGEVCGIPRDRPNVTVRPRRRRKELEAMLPR